MRVSSGRAIRGWLIVMMLVLLGSLAPAVPPAAAQVTASPAAFALPWTPPAPGYRVKVDTDGLYALSYTALSTAGLPVGTLDPRSLRMYYMGTEIPIRVSGEDDGVFDASDVVLFYGRGVDSLFLDGVLPTNKYTASSVYWLTYDCASGPCAGPYGLRMTDVDGSGSGSTPPDFVHRERQWRSRNYLSAYPFEHDADHWFDDQVTSFANLDRTFRATNLSASSTPATLNLRLLGYGSTQPEHHLRVWVNPLVNPTPIIDGSPGWTGFDIYTTSVQVPQSYLVEGTNTIRLRLIVTSGSDFAYPDWYDFFYYDRYVAESNLLDFNNADAGTWRYDVSNFTTPDVEVYDVTDPFAPQRFINTTITPAGATFSVGFGDTAAGAKKYLALTAAARKTTAVIEPATFLASPYRPSNLLDSANAADYIIITHRDFWGQGDAEPFTLANALADYRAYDFRVALVDVQQIYDQFNGGMMSAESIRDFLAYAHANWTGAGDPNVKAPAYVLLMGDGTNDMRKYRSAYNTYIPPFLYLADPDMGETAADNRFVTFIGNDSFPDMHLGRFPVNNVTEAQAMIDKVLYYEVACHCNDTWNKHTLFLADDLEGGGGNFYYYSDLIADGYVDAPANTIKLLPADFTVQKEYLGMTCDLGNPADAVQCRTNTVNALNTTGALFVSFVGHATQQYWAVEHMFDSNASALLTNGPCLPIMLPMTCYEGSFQDYRYASVMSETVVRQPVSGAVASFAPTGFGLVTGHDYLEEGLMLAWFHEGINRLGDATTYAKQYLVDNSSGQYLDLLDTFGLLGDPALQVKTPDVCLIPTAVTMNGFAAEPAEGGAQVTWQTADESDILGFNVLRRSTDFGREGSAGAYSAVNAELITAAYMGLAQGNSYSYLDTDVRPGETYQYQIEIIKLDGASEFYGSSEFGTVGLQLLGPQVQ